MKERYPHRFLDPDNLMTIRRLPENESGILDKSEMYLHLPSKFARQFLFYAPYIGHFYCNSSYNVSRNNFDYYLFIFVDSGVLHVSVSGKNYSASKNDIIILNCKKPHLYYAKGDASFYFFHFDGSISTQLYDLIVSRQGTIVHSRDPVFIMNTLTSIFTMAKSGYENELKISAQIHVVLSEMISQNIPAYDYTSEVITKAVRFMEKHFGENISIKTVAESVFLSEYRFSHLFKKYTNISPHAYIVKLRIIYACQLLEGSTHAIEVVGKKCGFNSTQHFIRTFSLTAGCSPSQYRKKNQTANKKLKNLWKTESID
jgi:AraC-like DNA-binding protein